MADIEIEIDGKKLMARPDQMVIQVADEAGIYIPRFCYHKYLSIAANCRMCLVEVEKAPKPLPACATPVTPGLKVFTKSPKAIAAQRAVMEFLLINHPLDCPICDQGGECELQDLAMGYGPDKSCYREGKRSVADENLGPLIATAMTRCIQCTRCVRFGDEVAGLRELGAVGRGEHMEIETYVGKAMQSEVSGNIIDICPVGALTSKPFLYTARAWELDQKPSIAPHDCLGSNLYVHTRSGKVMRVAPHENNRINTVWLSDRDRFSYEALYHGDRLTKPMVRSEQNHLQEVEWQQALEIASFGLQRIVDQHDAQSLGALASPNATLEELFLLQKLMRSLGSNNIDHRLRQTDFRDEESVPLFPGLGIPVIDLQNCDGILLIGSNIQKEQPIAGLHVRRAALRGAAVATINMMDYRTHFPLAEKKIVAPQELVSVLKELPENITAVLRNKRKAIILLGALALNHPQAAQIKALAHHIAEQTGARVGFLTEGANAAGAWLAGAVPHRAAAGQLINTPGLNAVTMLREKRKGYILLNVEPDLDCANPPEAILALRDAEFVIALSLFKNPVLEQYADVILPIAPFTETSGTFVNAAGDWQSFKGTAAPFGDARPAWKVLRVLGNFLHLEGFEYENSNDISMEVNESIPPLVENKRENTPDYATLHSQGKIHRIAEVPIYATDNLVRHAPALQKAQEIMYGELGVVRIHPHLANELQVQEGERVRVKQKNGEAELWVRVDDRVPNNAAWIATGIPETAGLRELFGEVEISK